MPVSNPYSPSLHNTGGDEPDLATAIQSDMSRTRYWQALMGGLALLTSAALVAAGVGALAHGNFGEQAGSRILSSAVTALVGGLLGWPLVQSSIAFGDVAADARISVADAAKRQSQFWTLLSVVLFGVVVLYSVLIVTIVVVANLAPGP